MVGRFFSVCAEKAWSSNNGGTVVEGEIDMQPTIPAVSGMLIAGLIQCCQIPIATQLALYCQRVPFKLIKH